MLSRGSGVPTQLLNTCPQRLRPRTSSDLSKVMLLTKIPYGFHVAEFVLRINQQTSQAGVGWLRVPALQPEWQCVIYD